MFFSLGEQEIDGIQVMKVNLEVLSFRVSSWDSVPLLLSASRKVSRLQGGAKVSEGGPLGLSQSAITL